MPRAADETRSAILDTAERLFAAKGIDAVSNAEITEAAGQRNNSAIAYHFGDRNGMFDALLRRHVEPLDERRNELLDALPGEPTLTQVVHVLVGPLADLLHSESGRAYLRIQAQLLGRRDDRDLGLSPFVTQPETRPGLDRITGLLASGAHLAAAGDPVIRTRLATTLLFHSLADRAGETERGDDAEFVVALERAVEALLVIPLC